MIVACDWGDVWLISVGWFTYLTLHLLGNLFSNLYFSISVMRNCMLCLAIPIMGGLIYLAIFISGAQCHEQKKN
jgi:hypothetical protein